MSDSVSGPFFTWTEMTASEDVTFPILPPCPLWGEKKDEGDTSPIRNLIFNNVFFFNFLLVKHLYTKSLKLQT